MTWKDVPWRPTRRSYDSSLSAGRYFVGLLGPGGVESSINQQFWRAGGGDGRAGAGQRRRRSRSGLGQGAWIRPATVRPVFLALTILTLPLNWVMSRVLMAVLFLFSRIHG